jgi:hypothetical protein
MGSCSTVLCPDTLLGNGYRALILRFYGVLGVPSLGFFCEISGVFFRLECKVGIRSSERSEVSPYSTISYNDFQAILLLRVTAYFIIHYGPLRGSPYFSTRCANLPSRHYFVMSYTHNAISIREN